MENKQGLWEILEELTGSATGGGGGGRAATTTAGSCRDTSSKVAATTTADNDSTHVSSLEASAFPLPPSPLKARSVSMIGISTPASARNVLTNTMRPSPRPSPDLDEYAMESPRPPTSRKVLAEKGHLKRASSGSGSSLVRTTSLPAKMKQDASAQSKLLVVGPKPPTTNFAIPPPPPLDDDDDDEYDQNKLSEDTSINNSVESPAAYARKQQQERQQLHRLSYQEHQQQEEEAIEVTHDENVWHHSSSLPNPQLETAAPPQHVFPLFRELSVQRSLHADDDDVSSIGSGSSSSSGSYSCSSDYSSDSDDDDEEDKDEDDEFKIQGTKTKTDSKNKKNRKKKDNTGSSDAEAHIGNNGTAPPAKRKRKKQHSSSHSRRSRKRQEHDTTCTPSGDERSWVRGVARNTSFRSKTSYRSNRSFRSINLGQTGGEEDGQQGERKLQLQGREVSFSRNNKDSKEKEAKSLSSWKKYDTFDLKVSKDNEFKAKEIQLCRFSRPHMRAYYIGNWCLLISLMCWFGAITPLMPEIRTSLDLSHQDIWIGSIISMPLATLLPIPTSWFCEKYGSRIPMMYVLCLLSVPMAFLVFIQSPLGFFGMRLVSGGFAATLVCTQVWASRMFVQRVVGAASGIIGSGGGFEIGFSQLLIGVALFPNLRDYLLDGDADLAWRAILILPPVLAFVTGIIIYVCTDDTPKGNLSDLKRKGCIQPEVELTVARHNFQSSIGNLNAWILHIQYAAMFGVFLTFTTIAPLYYYDKYGQSTESSAAISSIYGWVGLVSRFFGGYLSDRGNRQAGLRGRLWMFTTLLIVQGLACILFANTDSLSMSIAVMSAIAFFQGAALAAAMTIVPYVNPSHLGSVAGIVNSGGGVGGIAFGMVFLMFEDYSLAFRIMGAIVLATCLLSAFISIRGHTRMFEIPDSNYFDASRRFDDSARDSSMDEELGHPRGGSSAGGRGDDSETAHLSLSTAANNTKHGDYTNALAVDFTGTVSVPFPVISHATDNNNNNNNINHDSSNPSSISSQVAGECTRNNTKNNKKKPRRRSTTVKCRQNHACYEASMVYEAFDDPEVLRSFLGSAPTNCYCRECRGRIALTPRKGGIIPSPGAPVYVCRECHKRFVCSVCFQGATSAFVPEWARKISDSYFR